MLLRLFTAISLSVNHFYTTEILGKEQKTLCKRLLMKHYHDKGFLGWLNGGMAPPPLLLELPWINTLSLNNGTFGNLLQTLKNLELGPDFSQRPVVVMVTISFAVIGHTLYKPVSHSHLL